MSEKNIDMEPNEDVLPDNNEAESVGIKPHVRYLIPSPFDENYRTHLSGMFLNWYLDYASYANLNRAIPHIKDGLKPVQRRVLFSMKRMEDGRYNKVANIVGHTMQFHPHGDSSIYEALVGLGQKNILIDTQGNWGNILTGDGAAAARYIEARLSEFALNAVFNSKTTDYKPSYDGRNKEPIALPIKFPLLLAQGSEGIGVGLNSKILPHNFNELLDASIFYLQGKEFELFPDFLTGGMIDVSNYKDGERGGKVKIRAKITKSADNKLLVISDIPYGVTTTQLIDSIVRASEKGKINIKKIDDNTSENAEIIVALETKTSSDKTIDALYAFTMCEVSYSPNCCVIDNDKPVFITVSQVLKRSVENTVDLLKSELEILLEETSSQLLYVSLEKIFIDQRVYKDKEFENSRSTDEALNHIETRIKPLVGNLASQITRADFAKLLEIKMARILKFNSDIAADNIKALKAKIEDINQKLNNLIEYAIDWFESLKKKYGRMFARNTEIRNFENILVSKVVEANAKLYVNKQEGFIGMNPKKDDSMEFVQNCSDIDDVIVFFANGKYKIVKVSEKQYVGKDIVHLSVYIRNDQRTIYNAIYRDGKNGSTFVKRFAVSGVTRDKEYDLTLGSEGSKLLYFSANPNGEAEVVRIQLKQQLSRRIKKLAWDLDFQQILIKGRASRGNVLTKFAVSKINFKQSGGSTLGGTNIWFDRDVLKLNTDQRGVALGEFFNNDQILVVQKNGSYYTTNFELTNYFDEDILIVEKFDANKIWSVAFFDSEQNFSYIKRFKFDTSSKRVSFVGETIGSKLLLISDDDYPLFKVVFGGNDKNNEPLTVDVEQFIGEKSLKARGKRISTKNIASVVRLEPKRMAEPPSPELTDIEPTDTQEEEVSKPKLIYDSGEDSTQGTLF